MSWWKDNSLPSLPVAKGSISQPLVHFHPTYLHELRNQLREDSKVAFLLRTLLKKVMVDERVHSVTFSKRVGPGGPNAFLSLAPHFHPDREQVAEYLNSHPNATEEEWCDQVEWKRIDGKRNDDQGGATQTTEVNEVSSKVFLLALGYDFALRFDPKNANVYAEKAFKLMKVFFSDPETAMLPEVLYGQYIRGNQEKSTMRPEGLLHVRPLIMISQVLALLPAPPSLFSPHSFMEDWLRRHVYFLKSHEVGRKGAMRKSNIGTHYLTLLTTHLVAINEPLEAHSTILDFFNRTSSPSLSSKIDEYGVLVEEVKRPNPFHYTAFELEALTFLLDLVCSIRLYHPSATRDLGIGLQKIRTAVDFAIAYYLRSLPHSNPPALPPSVPGEIEKESDVRSILFQTRSVAVKYDEDQDNWGKQYEWLVGRGGDGEMEPLKGIPFKPKIPFTGWTVSARLRWALLEKY